jgi:hypothetical protein
VTTVPAAEARLALRGPPTWVAIALVLALATSPSAESSVGDAPSRYLGRPLIEVLEELRSRGLNLMFSSAVVSKSLVVTDEPTATAPRAILDQILPPLGLQARNGAGGSILIVPAALPDPARAGPAPPPRLVEDIVVTPGHHEIIPQDMAATRSIDRRDVIIAPTLGSDASRAVTLLPGIAATDTSATFNARGSAAGDVSLILDGLELYDPFHLSGLQSPFSFIDGRMVDSVDFVGGGFTADRGDRHGGFVEMSSASPAPGASTQLEIGTLNSRISYETSTPLGPILVSGRYWYPDAVADAVAFGDDGLRPRFADAYLKFGLLATPETVISGHALLASDSASLVETDGNERVDAGSRSGTLWFRVLRSWSPEVATDTVVSAGRTVRSRSGVADPDDEPITVEDNRSVRFSGLRNDVSWAIGGATVLRGGIDVRFLGADLSYAEGDPTATAGFVLKPSGASLAAYAAVRRAFSSRLVAELGVRWDRQTYTGDRQWSPRLNLVWQAGPQSEVRLGAGSFSQSLRIHELRIEDGETSYRPPEFSRQLDLTYLHRFAERWSLRIDAYLHHLGQLQPRYENLFHPVELFPSVEQDRVLVAPESAELRGVEVSVNGDPGARLQWWANYAWATAEDVIDGAKVPRSWDQTHAANFLLAYRWAPGWSLAVNGTAHTGWPTTPVTGRVVTLPDGTTEIAPVAGVRNSARYPVYARLDAKAGRTIATAKGSLSVELSIINLTDRSNACCVDEVYFEANAAGGIETRTTYDYWLGITPSLQVLWRF